MLEMMIVSIVRRTRGLFPPYIYIYIYIHTYTEVAFANPPAGLVLNPFALNPGLKDWDLF